MTIAVKITSYNITICKISWCQNVGSEMKIPKGLCETKKVVTIMHLGPFDSDIKFPLQLRLFGSHLYQKGYSPII